MSGLRLGIADHLGWAVAVVASAGHSIVERRRIELVEPGITAAPVHHVGGPWEMHREGEPLDDAALAKLVAEVRASARRATAAALDALPGPIVSLSLRAWPVDFPDDVAVQRTVPHESRADAVMYRQVLAEAAHERGWAVHVYDARRVESEAAHLLGDRADAVLRGPRAVLGPPWTVDHRRALAATVLAG